MVSDVLSFKQLHLLACGLLIALLPLFTELPIWIFPYAVAVYLWRFKALEQPSSTLGRWISFKRVKILVVACSLLALTLSVANVFSLQGFVSLLVLTAILKLLELITRRDYLLLIFLGSLVAACQLLFSNSLLSFSYTIFSLFVLHVILLRTFSNRTVNKHSLASKVFIVNQKAALYKTFIIFIQALPVAIALFIVMPRIGSLWTVPLNSGVAKTGVSDTLRAGDIAKLNQDHSVAMRVTFTDNTLPEMGQMYWRGLSLSHFDGDTWRVDKNLAELSSKQYRQLTTATSNGSYNYQVMLEANGRSWLYGLDTAMVKSAALKQWQDYSIRRKDRVGQRYQYALASPVTYQDQSSLSVKEFRYYTALPGEQNPRARQYAKQVWEQSASTTEFVTKLSSRFRQDFSYTLAPGVSTSEHAIDDFLFSSKQGYCEHFASTGAFLLRAAGVPARIVTGYQGGQWSADQQYLLVTQAQAHAWLEYWQPSSGWVRWDPTTFVSPQRVEQGANDFSQALSSNNLFGQINNSSWLNQWRMSVDNFNYQWHRWVIDYSAQRQFSLVKKLLGEVSGTRIGLFMLAIFGLVMLPLLVGLYRNTKRKPSDPLLLVLQGLEKKLQKHQLQRLPRETLTEFLAKAATKYPEQASIFSQIAKLVERQMYAKTAVTVGNMEQIKGLIKQIK